MQAEGMELPAETSDVEHMEASTVLDQVAEVGPNYTLLRPKEKKKERRKRLREKVEAEQAEAADESEAPRVMAAGNGTVGSEGAGGAVRASSTTLRAPA